LKGSRKIQLPRKTWEEKNGFLMIRSLFWNIRGMSKKGSGPYVRDLLQDKKYDFVCVQETILKQFDEKCLRRFDPNRNFLWDWIPAVGKSGGVLSGFSVYRFDVGSRVQGKYILKHCLWDRKMEVKWNVMNVYGAPHEKDKEDFLAEMAIMCSQNKEPYVIGGDFNLLRYSSEKNRSSQLSRHSSVFNSNSFE
jgi:exonuclease III